MDHAAAERLDPLQRPGQIVYGEVGQGEGVTGPATPRMEPDLPFVSGLEGISEQSGPEASSPLGIIRGKLDQTQPRAGHAKTIATRRPSPG